MITKETIISEAVEKNERAAEIMFKHGLHCIGCHVSAHETIEQGCKAHGLSDKEIDEIVKEMNKAEKKKD